jgi:hypothetical protein
VSRLTPEKKALGGGIVGREHPSAIGIAARVTIRVRHDAAMIYLLRWELTPVTLSQRGAHDGFSLMLHVGGFKYQGTFLEL